MRSSHTPGHLSIDYKMPGPDPSRMAHLTNRLAEGSLSHGQTYSFCARTVATELYAHGRFDSRALRSTSVYIYTVCSGGQIPRSVCELLKVVRISVMSKCKEIFYHTRSAHYINLQRRRIRQAWVSKIEKKLASGGEGFMGPPNEKYRRHETEPLHYWNLLPGTVHYRVMRVHKHMYTHLISILF